MRGRAHCWAFCTLQPLSFAFCHGAQAFAFCYLHCQFAGHFRCSLLLRFNTITLIIGFVVCVLPAPAFRLRRALAIHFGAGLFILRHSYCGILPPCYRAYGRSLRFATRVSGVRAGRQVDINHFSINTMPGVRRWFTISFSI